MEKDITTPDYYPLSLNALVNACNQKNNREPVTNFDEETVRLALRNLSEKQLAGMARGADGRVAKYEHHLQEVFNFTRGETAIICVLLLRGPQTPGELRGRTERMHRFEDLEDVLTGLLAFFAIPILMIGYPSVKSYAIGDMTVTLQGTTNALQANPGDQELRAKLQQQLSQLDGRQFSDPEKLMILSKAQFALGNNQTALTNVNKALQANPNLPAARELQNKIASGTASGNTSSGLQPRPQPTPIRRITTSTSHSHTGPHSH